MSSAFLQKNNDATNNVAIYIETYKNVAMQHMTEYGIPASIKLAQAILESGYGTSNLARHANNHFGIKCHGWEYATYYQDDDEKDECFRSYHHPVYSFIDHSEFLTTRGRYSFLFELDPLDYVSWANGLSKAGYATNPDYPKLLINLIKRHDLHRFDLMVMDGYEPDIKPSKTTGFRAGPNFQKRKAEYNNRIKYIYAREGETPEMIAAEMEIWASQIYRYNEIEEGTVFNRGDIIYLQPKRRRGKEKYHIVEEGETLFDISQKYGVRIKYLYRRNDDLGDKDKNEEIEAGKKIVLRGNFFGLF